MNSLINICTCMYTELVHSTCITITTSIKCFIHTLCKDGIVTNYPNKHKEVPPGLRIAILHINE